MPVGRLVGPRWWSAPLSGLYAFASDIKISHSVFALPFAASALLLVPLPMPDVGELMLLLICMVSARAFAMGSNRYLDAKLDAQNERTAQRAIPRGAMSRRQSAIWTLLFGAIFITSSAALSPLAGALSLPLLIVLGAYSLMKHVSWVCHYYLGFCLGLAPVGVAVALLGDSPLPILLLTLAITAWTGGFDIIYAIQDLGFDRSRGLQSVPARFGIRVSLYASRFSFGVCVIALIAVGLIINAGVYYYIGVACVAGLLVFEQWLVRDVENDSGFAKLNLAFFSVNAYVSLTYFCFLTLDTWLV